MTDPRRTRLDRMMRLFAYRQRIPFGVAWTRLDEQLRARRIDIDREIERLRREKRIPLAKKLSTPAALELAGQLDTAINIAQRMLGGGH